MSAYGWLKALFKLLVLPPNGPLLAIIIGLVVARWRPLVGRTLALIGASALLLLSIPAVGDMIVSLLHPPRTPFKVEDAREAQAIVIIGGGVRRDAPEYGGDTLARLSLDRVRYGARVARMTGLPVLVSGGHVTGGQAEATLMRAALEGEFRVPVRWIEPRSRNTHENAIYSARILSRDGVRRIVLVSHAFDVWRASREFENAGLEVVPAATHLAPPGEWTYADWLPGISGLQLSYYALYELFANIALSLSTLHDGRAAPAGGR